VKVRASLDCYLETCAKHGIAPKKQASGKFVVRIPPALHAQAAVICLFAPVEKPSAMGFTPVEWK